MSMPIWRIALGQKGAPTGAPDRSKERIRRRSVSLPVIHSIARMVPALNGLVKVPA